jgi:hypothetical protein
MSFLSTSCKIFHFSFLAMSKNRFQAMSFLAMYGHRKVECTFFWRLEMKAQKSALHMYYGILAPHNHAEAHVDAHVVL